MAFATLLLPGCGVSKLYTQYEREGVEFVDSLYRRLPDLKQDSTSIGSLAWTDFFDDPILQEWIRLGIEHNTDLAVARLRGEQAQASLWEAGRAFFPGASVSFSTSGGFPGNGTQPFRMAPTFSWEADIFGKVANSKRRAAAALEQSDAYRQAVQAQLVATIAESYYRLLMLDEQLAISERTLKTWEENIST